MGMGSVGKAPRPLDRVGLALAVKLPELPAPDGSPWAKDQGTIFVFLHEQAAHVLTEHRLGSERIHRLLMVGSMLETHSSVVLLSNLI